MRSLKIIISCSGNINLPIVPVMCLPQSRTLRSKSIREIPLPEQLQELEVVAASVTTSEDQEDFYFVLFTAGSGFVLG